MRPPVHPNRPELASAQLELQDHCVSVKSKTTHPQVMVMWVTWFAIFAGLFIIHQFAAPIPEGAGIIGMFAVPVEQTNERSLMLSMSIACVLISAPIYAVKKLKEFTSQEAA